MAIINGTAGADTLTGTDADDTIFGRAGSDRIDGSIGNDRIKGGLGDDVVLLSQGTDTVVAGAGVDTLDLRFATNGIVLDARTGVGVFSAGTVRFSGVEVFRGSTGDDSLRGSVGADTMFANDANDTDLLAGRGGNDILYGGGGRDVLRGGAGNDYLQGGNDKDLSGVWNDVLDGGAGDDVLDLVDSVSGMRIVGGSGSDRLLTIGLGSDVAVDLQLGTLLRPEIRGEAPPVILISEVENVVGGDGADDLRGDGFANRLTGGEGGDVLDGRDGDDRLRGETGSDDLSGGPGADLFVYASLADSGGRDEVDVIRDFNPSQGDRIDLRRIDAVTGAGGGNEAFRFIGSGEFTGVGQVRSVQSASDTIVTVQVDNNAGVDMTIRLAGLLSLTEANFIL